MKRRLWAASTIFVLLVLSGYFFLKLLHAPYELDNYRDAIERIGLQKLHSEADNLVANRGANAGERTDQGHLWKRMSQAPAAMRMLPFVQEYSVEKDRVIFSIRDLDLCFLEIYSSEYDGEESDTGYSRTRKIADRIYLFEAWYKNRD